jgi:hypothetical protein
MIFQDTMNAPDTFLNLSMDFPWNRCMINKNLSNSSQLIDTS